VRFHQPPLVEIERRGLAEDVVGDPDLPDVVEEKSVLDAPVLQKLGSDLVGELERIALYALGVGARPAVLESSARARAATVSAYALCSRKRWPRSSSTRRRRSSALSSDCDSSGASSIEELR